MDKIKEGVPLRLQSERKNNGLTQDQLAAATGVSKVTLSSYETGTTSPTIRFLADIGKLGLDVHHILFGTNKPDDSEKLEKDFRIIQNCFDHVTFYEVAKCIRCPDQHRWWLVRELFIYARYRHEMTLQEAQTQIDKLFHILKT